MYEVTPYMNGGFSPAQRKTILKELLFNIRNSKIKFDAIAYRGHSGALFAPSVADELDKSLLLIRSSNRNCHSSYPIEGVFPGYNWALKKKRSDFKYIIIDDFISTGNTLVKIITKIKEYSTSASVEIKCVGVFTWRDAYSSEEDKQKKLITKRITKHKIQRILCDLYQNKRKEPIVKDLPIIHRA